MTTLPPQTPEEQQAIMLQQHAAAANHAKEVNVIVAHGQEHFGTARFDEASAVVAKALGERAQDVMALMRQCDKPHELIVHLANNEGQLENLAKLNTPRQIKELLRIEMQMAPHGHVPTGADPLWKTLAGRSGRVSDADWKKSLGEGLSDDQWNKEFDRRQAARQRR